MGLPAAMAQKKRRREPLATGVSSHRGRTRLTITAFLQAVRFPLAGP
jgi:hypothetical protein